MASQLTELQEKAIAALKGKGGKSLEALFDLVTDGRMQKMWFFQEHLKPLVKSGRIAAPQGRYWLVEELPATEKWPAEGTPTKELPATEKRAEEGTPAEELAAAEKRPEEGMPAEQLPATENRPEEGTPAA